MSCHIVLAANHSQSRCERQGRVEKWSPTGTKSEYLHEPKAKACRLPYAPRIDSDSQSPFARAPCRRTYRTRSPIVVVRKSADLTAAAEISQPGYSLTGGYAFSLRGLALVRSACQTRTRMHSSSALTL